MSHCRKPLSLLLLLCLVPLSFGQSRRAWHQATPAELSSALPARATVEKEHIETEMRTASGAVDSRGRIIAAVVLITAGYSANGKYSHYLLTQVPLQFGSDALLPPGSYVIGWTREGDQLAVKFYEAESGKERVAVAARPLPAPSPVVSIKVWPPGERSAIQIGRFFVSYKVGE